MREVVEYKARYFWLDAVRMLAIGAILLPIVVICVGFSWLACQLETVLLPPRLSYTLRRWKAATAASLPSTLSYMYHRAKWKICEQAGEAAVMVMTLLGLLATCMAMPFEYAYGRFWDRKPIPIEEAFSRRQAPRPVEWAVNGLTVMYLKVLFGIYDWIMRQEDQSQSPHTA